MIRRTRIVATLGPATDRPGVLEALLDQGLDVARINFSHGTAAEHEGRVARLRRLAEGRPRPVAVLADLPGPKLRVLLDAPLVLTTGQELTLAAAGDASLRLSEPELVRGLQVGQRVLLDDGRLQARAVGRDGDRVRLRVEVGGTLQPRKGVNLPDTQLTLPALTPRDHEALAVAARVGVDWVALSFVRGADAALPLRAALEALGLRVAVLAKIERPEAVERAAEILDAFDGIMVARGDLGVELPLEQVPHVQKRLINLARQAGKPVITATDMLDSMRANPRPTRAEASDVANAIYDATDAVMLSGETAAGQYPVEAFAAMDCIVREAEAHREDDPTREVVLPRGTLDDHVTALTCQLAREVHADAIVATTHTGLTARLMARHRPQTAVVATTESEAVLRQLALVWGLTPVLQSTPVAAEDRLEAAVRAAFHHGALRAGYLVVVLAGHPVEGGERFPTLRVIRVGTEGQSLAP